MAGIIVQKAGTFHPKPSVRPVAVYIVVRRLSGDIYELRFKPKRYDVLVARMEEMGIELDSLKWYCDLRRFGSVKHAGFGLGLERFILYLTNIGNIRDTIPYARPPRNLMF